MYIYNIIHGHFIYISQFSHAEDCLVTFLFVSLFFFCAFVWRLNNAYRKKTVTDWSTDEM